MTVKRLKVLSEVVISLDECFIAVAHALQVLTEAIDVQLHILNVLVSYSHCLVDFLVFQDFAVFLAEETLLELDCLGI